MTASVLSQMAREELRYDSLPPHLMARPKTLADLERIIASLQDQLAAIARQMIEGTERRSYLEDCQDRTRQQLTIYREARAKMIEDGAK